MKRQGLHAPPIDLSSTYPISDLDAATASLDAMVAGCEPTDNPIYSRLHNPTVANFEQALAQLEHAEAAVAFGSGMAAFTAVLQSAAQDGGHVVAVRPLYGTSDHLLCSGLVKLQVDWVDAQQIAGAIRDDTALVVIETPANPTLKLVDIEAVVAQASTVPVMVDSTFATPILQQPLRHGASLVLHSATKYLGGHGDVIAGVVACSEPWARRLRQIRLVTGALLHPLGAYLLHRGLPTLALRIHAAQASAAEIAQRLQTHPAVSMVHYPGVVRGAQAQIRDRQMAGGGCMVAFELKGGYEAARALLASVQLITPAVSLGSVDSLIQHPAGMTHRVVPEEVRLAAGIDAGLVRLSVGVEHVDDLWQDLSQALAAAGSVTFSMAS